MTDMFLIEMTLIISTSFEKKYFPTKVRFAHIYFSHLKQDTGGVSGKKSNF